MATDGRPLTGIMSRTMTEPANPVPPFGSDGAEPVPSPGELLAEVDRTGLKAAWVGRLVMTALAVLLVVVIGRFIRRVDWSMVWSALSQLSWWQPLLLFVLVLFRQVANGAPLMFNIPGVTLRQAAISDLAASTMGVIAPPPSESALRIAMFRSWGTPLSLAVAGAVMNSVTFFLIRFSAPALGFLVVALTGRSVGLRWLDVISLLIAALLLIGLLLVVRTATWARWGGLQAGRLARRLRPEVDPDAWADACAAFRDGIAGRFGFAFPRALLANLVMLMLDATILFASLRFVGLTTDQLPAADILIAYLFAFPLTAFPMSGLGVVDAAALASMVEAGGPAVTEPAIAGLIIWRLFTVVVVFLLGLIAVGAWRRASGRQQPMDEVAD